MKFVIVWGPLRNGRHERLDDDRPQDLPARGSERAGTIDGVHIEGDEELIEHHAPLGSAILPVVRVPVRSLIREVPDFPHKPFLRLGYDRRAVDEFVTKVGLAVHNSGKKPLPLMRMDDRFEAFKATIAALARELEHRRGDLTGVVGNLNAEQREIARILTVATERERAHG